ncbi:MAG TPA: helix-hairpin-helix domain-containing protein [Xanthobacteraceae bacterium]|jgi:DNA uptake protein ComE-like DNA-binding protein
MSTNRVLLGALALALLTAPGFAQDNKPSTSPAPRLTAPMPAPKASTTGAATTAATTKTNLNSASEADLGKLPKITPAQSKAIVEARAKSKFKSWDDFVGRKLVPADTAAAIKGAVSF